MIFKKKLFNSLSFCIIFLIAVTARQTLNAQEKRAKNLNNKEEPSEVTKNIYNPFLFTNKFEIIIPQEEPGVYNLNLPENNPGEAWGMTLAELRQSNYLNSEKGNLRVNLYLKNFLYPEEGMIKEIRNILGIAGMSAAGYFAFKHIQKYGFIESKKKK